MTTTTRWLTGDEARAWRGFTEMRVALDAVLERQLAEHGLSSADYVVLVHLSEADGPLRARALARATAWDRSRLSHHLRRMEGRGLVERFDCSEDARGTMVGLTDAGQRAIEAAAPGHVETVRSHVVDLLSPEELRVLADITERVRDACEQDRPSTC